MAPSSVSTASTVTQGPVALPLFKFSHCTSPNPQAKMIWTHLPQRSDMFAILDVIRKVGGGIASETKVLKIVRGGELLEQVELQTLQDQVRMDEERALSQYIPDNLLQVLVIVKRPLLALRYSLPVGRIRRMQMNFVPLPGCDVALEALKAAGLPIRDKDLPQVQSQRPQASQLQPHPYQKYDTSNVDKAAPHPSSQGTFSGSSQPLPEQDIGSRDPVLLSIPTSMQPKNVNTRPTSAPERVKRDGPSRPISVSSRSSLNALWSPITITSQPTVAKPTTQSSLLSSPVFNGTYEPFGSFEVRPLSAPEQTPILRNDTHTALVSQMLPPERTILFQESHNHSNRTDAGASQERPAATKTKAKRQTNPRTQPAKSRNSRTKDKAKIISSDPLAPSSPSSASRAKSRALAPNGPLRVASPDLQAATQSAEPPAIPTVNSRKRSLNEPSMDQPNKRKAHAIVETVVGNINEAFTTATVIEQPIQATFSDAKDPLFNISSHDVLNSIDTLMRKYYDLRAPKSPRTSKDYLAEYAAQSEDDRVKAVDNLICECNKDENFAKLMEDVEGGWKRIGLGL